MPDSSHTFPVTYQKFFFLKKTLTPREGQNDISFLLMIHDFHLTFKAQD